MMKWNRFDTDCKNEWAILTLKWFLLTKPTAIIKVMITIYA